MNANKEMIKIVARRLDVLNDKVAFLGGSSVSFLITDSAAPEVRATKDVDVIIDIGSRQKYYEAEDFLNALPGHLPPDKASQARVSLVLHWNVNF